MKYAIAAAALICAASLEAAPPATEGWSRIDEGTAQDHWIRDRDWTAGRPESTSALVWTWVDHKRSRTVSHELILLEINCPAEAFRFVQMQSFDHRGQSTSMGGNEWEYAAPTTIIGEIVRVTCMEPQDTPPPVQTRPDLREFW